MPFWSSRDKTFGNVPLNFMSARLSAYQRVNTLRTGDADLRFLTR